jgi:hypothetical protein
VTKDAKMQKKKREEEIIDIYATVIFEERDSRVRGVDVLSRKEHDTCEQRRPVATFHVGHRDSGERS